MKTLASRNRFKLITTVGMICLGLSPLSLASQTSENTGSEAEAESTIGIESVPEPSTSALIGLAGVFLILRRRKIL